MASKTKNDKHLFIVAGIFLLFYGLYVQFSAVENKLGTLEVLGGQKMQTRVTDKSLKKLALVMEESQKDRMSYNSDEYAFAKIFDSPEQKKPKVKPKPEPVVMEQSQKSPEPKRPEPIDYLNKVAKRLRGEVNGISDSGIFVGGRFIQKGKDLKNVPLSLEGEILYTRLTMVDVADMTFGIGFKGKTKTIQVKR